jgi:DedD protein
MAFFKFRKGGDEQPTPSPAPESVEAIRRRALHRLIGAAVLVLLGVVGFPLVFDSQPRPIAVDIPIDIPDRNKVKPLGNLPVEAPVAQTRDAAESEVVVGAAAPAALEPKPAASAVAAVAVAPVPRPAPAPGAGASASLKPESKAQEKPAATKAPVLAPTPAATAVTPKVDDGSKARALLDGKVVEPTTPVGDARFVVQVGAFSDPVKAREARMKLEKAGLKTYTQVVEPKEGRRIRVRVGPFATRQEADKTVEHIKKLDLPASVLEL